MAPKLKKSAATANKRTATIVRNTTETRIDLELVIEGGGRYKVSTGIRFFDHMLELFTRHGAFDLELKCDGDLDVEKGLKVIIMRDILKKLVHIN